MIMNNYSKKKKIITSSILLIVSVLLVYIFIDQIIFFIHKSDITKFTNTYMQSVEDVNKLPSYFETSDAAVQKKLVNEKIAEFHDFYEKNFIYDISKKEEKDRLFQGYELGMRNILNKQGKIKQLSLKSVKIKSIKIPFISHVTVKLSYNIDYKANGSICYFNGANIFEINSGSADEEFSASEYIQTTFHLKEVNREWKISRIPRFRSSNISEQ